MWNRKRSIILSKICVWVFIFLLAAVLIAAPFIMSFFGFSEGDRYSRLFLATTYVGAVPAALLLIDLQRLLMNISRGDVFTDSNVSLLRRVSWYCFAGSAVALGSLFYYLPWGIVAIAAAFMGLIVRILKNIMAQAAALKAEADFTI